MQFLRSCFALIFFAAYPADAFLLAQNRDDVSASSEALKQTANVEMQELFLADQAIRLEVEKRGGWIAVKDDKNFMERWEREDCARLQRTKELLDTNALNAGIDFYRAAFIFQHSDKTEDFLKAHHLAVLSIAKGYDARWISAATLDRYLLATGNKQIYGTQFLTNDDGENVLRPINPEIVSDSERALLNVPALGPEP